MEMNNEHYPNNESVLIYDITDAFKPMRVIVPDIPIYARLFQFYSGSDAEIEEVYFFGNIVYRNYSTQSIQF